MKYDKETIKLMKIAANENNVNAQYGLALHYCGIGDKTKKDLKKSAYWAYKAAEIGTRDVRQLWLNYKLWKYKEGEIDEGLFEPIYAPNIKTTFSKQAISSLNKNQQ